MAREREQEKYLRVKMVESKNVEVSPGSFVQYVAGELYLLPEKQAQQWILNGSAVDPNAEEGES
jgi:hypothetical protein